MQMTKVLGIILAVALLLGVVSPVLAVNDETTENGEMPRYADGPSSVLGYAFIMCPAIVGYTAMPRVYTKNAANGEPVKFLGTCEYGLPAGSSINETPYGGDIRVWANANGFIARGIHDAIGPIVYDDMVQWPQCIANVFAHTGNTYTTDLSCGFFPAVAGVPVGTKITYPLAMSILQPVGSGSGVVTIYDIDPDATITSFVVTQSAGNITGPTMSPCTVSGYPNARCGTFGSNEVIVADAYITIVTRQAAKMYTQIMVTGCDKTSYNYVRCLIGGGVEQDYGQVPE